MSEDPSRTRESYDEIAATYTERMFTELAGKPLDRHLLNRFAEDVRDHGLVADLGCGPGHMARYLHEQGVRMLGIDLAPRMIEGARKLSPAWAALPVGCGCGPARPGRRSAPRAHPPPPGCPPPAGS